MENQTRNAIIKSVSLSTEPYSILTAHICVEYGDKSVQAFGGYALQVSKSSKHYQLLGPAGHFITRCMEIAGVTDWDKIAGKSIRVRGDDKSIDAIGHITKDDWFEPEIDFGKAVHKNG